LSIFTLIDFISRSWSLGGLVVAVVERGLVGGEFGDGGVDVAGKHDEDGSGSAAEVDLFAVLGIAARVVLEHTIESCKKVVGSRDEIAGELADFDGGVFNGSAVVEELFGFHGKEGDLSSQFVAPRGDVFERRAGGRTFGFFVGSNPEFYVRGVDTLLARGLGAATVCITGFVRLIGGVSTDDLATAPFDVGDGHSRLFCAGYYLHSFGSDNCTDLAGIDHGYDIGFALIKNSFSKTYG
jgi:hypothetical protein